MKELDLNSIPVMPCGVSDADSVEVYNSLSEMGAESGCGSAWGSGKGICFFACMEYIGSRYGMGYTDKYYEDNYRNSDFWPRGGYVKVDNQNAPFAYCETDEGPIPNPDTAMFLNEFFDTRDGSWKTKQSDIESYVRNNRKENKGQVMAVVKTGVEGVDHAIILDGDSGNYYSYKDPLYGERGDIAKDQVEYAIKIYGKKK